MKFTKELKQYDAVILKDGRRGAVVEIWGGQRFICGCWIISQRLG